MKLLRSRVAPVWIAAILGLLVTAWTFYPGFMSFDAAYQWYMVRTGDWVDVHPPLMLLVWTATEALLPGPGGVLLLHLTLYWSGLAALASALYDSPRRQTAFVVAIGFWPALLALLPFIWKDIGLLVAMIWVLAFLARDLRQSSRRFRALALLALTVACGYRYNALPLALPIAWYLAGRESTGSGKWRQVSLAFALFMVVALLAHATTRLLDAERRDLWSVTALWDIAAVSIAERDVLLPPEVIDPSLTVAELEAHFVPYNNVPVFGTGKIKEGLSSRYDASERRAVHAAYWRMWQEHPIAMLGHRLRLSRLLFGFAPAALPDMLAFYPVVIAYRDNPPVEPRASWLQERWAAATRVLIDTPMFALWAYVLAVALAFLVTRFGRRLRPTHSLLAPITTSALFYVLPLPLVSPSAEFRYLAWPVLAALVAMALILFPPRRTPP